MAAVRFVVLVFLFALPASGQTSPSPPEHGEHEAENHRNSPHFMVQKFLELTDRGEYAIAASFLSWPQGSQERQSLAQQLKTVIDRKGFINLSTISSESDGNPDDLVNNPDGEKIGEIKFNHTVVPIILHKNKHKTKNADGPAWQFERNFLKKIPDLHTEANTDGTGQLFPAWMSARSFGPLWPWQWLGLLLLFIGALLSARFTSKTVQFTMAHGPSASRAYFDSPVIQRVLPPLRILLIIALFRFGRDFLELPLGVRNTIGFVETTVTVLSLVAVGLRFADGLSYWLQHHLARTNKVNGMPMVLPMRKGLKILVFVVASLAIMRQFGFDVTAILAGLGVGGIAIALAGQKTIENLFGGISLVLDQPIRVGDFCKFGSSVGTIEDIGLRSTRIRTLDRTVISIPNADFSHMQIENYARRDKIRFQKTLTITYETTNDQMRLILIKLKELLLTHAMVERDPTRVRFIDFSDAGLEVQIFAYIRTSDYGEYLAVCEDLNLRVLEIIAGCGSGFAFPGKTVYLSRHRAADPSKVKQAHEEITNLREDGKLPLPYYPRDQADAICDTLIFK